MQVSRRLVLAAAAALSSRSALASTAKSPAPSPPVLRGPKPSIAVGKIEAAGGFAANENWDVGGALAAMLAQSLADSGGFVVIERAGLNDLLNERELQANRLAGGEAGPKMIAAQYLVVGSVTDFGGPSKGAGLSVGGFGLGGGGVGGVALNRQRGKVKIDLRLLDARTGEVVKAFSVARAASRTGLGLTTAYRGLSTGANAFLRTPLGEASRLALGEAVGHISQALAAMPWEGRVVDWDQGQLVINAGAEAGVAAGDRLRVERLGRVLTDPATGRVLSENRAYLGELVVETAEGKIARGRFLPVNAAYMPQRGDFVVALPAER